VLTGEEGISAAAIRLNSEKTFTHSIVKISSEAVRKGLEFFKPHASSVRPTELLIRRIPIK
jgi:hypothetical protein